MTDEAMIDQMIEAGIDQLVKRNFVRASKELIASGAKTDPEGVWLMTRTNELLIKDFTKLCNASFSKLMRHIKAGETK